MTADWTTCRVVRDRDGHAEDDTDAIVATEHTCTRHAPGTPACYYRHACRCDACRAAGGAQGKRARVARQSGRPVRVDATLAAAHVRRLAAVGMSARQVAVAAGVSATTVARVASGRQSHAEADTVAALLAVHPGPPDGWVPIHGVRRRVQALQTLGWSIRAIAEHADTTLARLAATLTSSRCRAATAQAVADAYEALWDAAPTTTRQSWAQTRARALRAGYVPPAAWDDGYGPHGIDNPDATPATPDEPRKRGPRTACDPAEVEWLADGGLTLDGIAHQLGVQRDTVLVALRRHGRGDLAARLAPPPEPALIRRDRRRAA